MATNTLHIHAQHWEHSDAYLVGDRDALQRLRDALDRALETGSAANMSYCADGEGYAVMIKMLESDDSYWRDSLLPYQTCQNEDSKEINYPFGLFYKKL